MSAAVVLRITRREGNVRLDFNCSRWLPSRTLTVEFPRNKLYEMRDSVGESLWEFKKKIVHAGLSSHDSLPAKVDLGGVRGALKFLFDRSQIWIDIIFDYDKKKEIQVRRMFCRAWYGWVLRGRKGDIPAVQVVSDLGDFIPLEFLPLVTRDHRINFPNEIRDLADLNRVAELFVGFSMIVERSARRGRRGQDSYLDNRPLLTLKMFADKGLPGSLREEKFFSGRNLIDLDGSWPREFSESESEDLRRVLAERLGNPRFCLRDVGEGQTGEIVRRLAAHLRYPDLGYRGEILEFPDQIHHFSCHCRVSGLSENYVISVFDRVLGRFKITLGELQARLSEFTPKRGGDMPLVFLNACGSAKINPLGMVSMPELFLKKIGSLGFIGPECAMPDVVAAELSICFYRHLFLNCCLGEALYRARKSLLNRYRNPLGIAYVAYVNPAIGLLNKVESEVRE